MAWHALPSIANWAEKRCQIVCGILFDLFYCMTSSDYKVIVNGVKAKMRRFESTNRK